MNFDSIAALAHPHRSARVLPRYRVAAPLPGYVSVARHFAQLVIDVGIRRLSVHPLQTQLIHTPARGHRVLPSSLYSPSSPLPNPPTHPTVDAAQTPNSHPAHRASPLSL